MDHILVQVPRHQVIGHLAVGEDAVLLTEGLLVFVIGGLGLIVELSLVFPD